MWDPHERMGVERMLVASAHGAPATAAKKLQAIIDHTKADELIVACALHSHTARLRSYELLAKLDINTVARSAA
jgi:alkanesulfonate monooxygenase SsuD/methylene tetrahydromethanopterin reductase-like flavin-dependent oxidoreductase (luciferase family)